MPRNYQAGIEFNAKDNASAIAAKVSGNVQSSVSAMGSAFEKHGAQVERFGMQLATMGAASTAAFGLAANEASKFEYGVEKLGTIFDATDVKSQKMAEGINRARVAYGKGKEEVSEALYQIGSAGVDAAHGLYVLDVAGKGAKGGFTDVLTAADGVTSALNAWKIEASEAGSVMDKFVMAQNKGKLTVGDMARGMGVAANTAASMGVSLDELAAHVSVATASGTKAATAFTNFQAAMIAVNRPSQDMVATADKIGVSFDSMKYSTLSTIEKMNYLAEVVDGDTGKLTALVGSSEAMRAILAQTGKNAETFTTDLKAMGDALGETDKAAQHMGETSTEQFNSMKQSLQITTEQIGTAFLPMMQSAAGAVSKVAETTTALASTPLGRVLIQIAGGAGVAAMAFGGFLVATVKVLNAVKATRDGISALRGMLASLSGASTAAGATATTSAGGLSSLGMAARSTSVKLMGVGAAAVSAAMSIAWMFKQIADAERESKLASEAYGSAELVSRQRKFQESYTAKYGRSATRAEMREIEKREGIQLLTQGQRAAVVSDQNMARQQAKFSEEFKRRFGRSPTLTEMPIDILTPEQAQRVQREMHMQAVGAMSEASVSAAGPSNVSSYVPALTASTDIGAAIGGMSAGSVNVQVVVNPDLEGVFSSEFARTRIARVVQELIDQAQGSRSYGYAGAVG